MNLVWILLVLNVLQLISQRSGGGGGGKKDTNKCTTRGRQSEADCPKSDGCYWDGLSCQVVFEKFNDAYYVNLPQTGNWADHVPLHTSYVNTTWAKLRVVGVPQFGASSIEIDIFDSTFSNSTCNPCDTEPQPWGRANQCQMWYANAGVMKVNLLGTPFSYVPAQVYPYGHIPGGTDVACSENNQVCEGSVTGYCGEIGLVLLPTYKLNIWDRDAYESAVVATVDELLCYDKDTFRSQVLSAEESEYYEPLFECQRCGDEPPVDYTSLSGFCMVRSRSQCTGNLATLREKVRSCNPFEGITESFNSMPAFVDWDADGDLDLVLGGASGRLRYFHQNNDHTMEEESQEGPFDSINEIANRTCHSLDYWTDGHGNNCSYYETRLLCANGTYGPRWKERFGTFNMHAGLKFNWLHAGTACCACGKGAGFGLYAAPALVDWDGDSSLDVFVGSMNGPLWYFKANDSNFVDHTDVGDTPFTTLQVSPYNTPAFIDWDDDGDLDLVVGMDEHGKLQYFERIGPSALVELTGSSNPFNGVAVVRRSVPTFADWDGDGDLDLIVGSRDGLVHYYERVSKYQVTERAGEGNSPFFDLDTGHLSSPAVVDWDRDGDLDLVTGQWMSGLRYYEHVPVDNLVEQSSVADDPFIEASARVRITHPAIADWDGDGIDDLLLGFFKPTAETGWTLLEYFTRASGESLKVEKKQFSTFAAISFPRGNYYQAAPSFVDWDADGDLDLVLTHETPRVDCGEIRYFENVFGNLTLMERVGPDNPFTGICARMMRHAFIDWDYDGDMDLVLGCNPGVIRYFERNGTELVEQIDSNTNPFSAIKVKDPAPAFVDWDGDGDQDLVVGGFDGKIRYFKRISADKVEEQTGANNPFTKVALSGQAVPKFADWDKDGDIDLITGESTGRVKFFARGYCMRTEPCSLTGICSVLKNKCECIFSHRAVDCSVCNAGYHAENFNYPLGCKMCSAGRFAPEDSLKCTDCPVGRVSQKASGFCRACPPGRVAKHEVEKSDCEMCPRGRFALPGSARCTLCPRGTFASFGTRICSECKAGKFAEENGMYACTPCPAGTYSTLGSKSCSNCTGGSVPSVRQDRCNACDAGYYAQAGDLRCRTCDEGTFAEYNSSECSVCEDGAYAQKGSAYCAPCPAGTFTITAGSACIGCPSGTYSAIGSSECQVCWTFRRPNSEQSECQMDGHLLTLVIACFIAQFAAIYPFCKHMGSKIMIKDVSQLGDMVVIVTLRKHHIRERFGIKRIKVHIAKTGDQMLSQIGYWPRVRVLDAMRLELLDDHNDPISDDVNSSMGYLIKDPLMSILTDGEKFPTLLLATAMLAVPWVLILLKEDQQDSRYLFGGIGLATLIAAGAGMMTRMRHVHARKTPMKTRLHKFRDEKSPQREKCAPGPDRAVKFKRIRELLHFFRDLIGQRNAYYLNSNIIKPLTKYDKLSFAEYVGPARVQFFVSHYWGTSFEHFVETLMRHALLITESDLGRSPLGKSQTRTSLAGADSIAYWVCFLSNNQWHLEEELGQWYDSSFYKALRSESCQGTCMVLDKDAKPLTRAWCLFEVLQTFEREREGHGFKGLIYCTERGVIQKDALEKCKDTCYDVALALSHRLVEVDVEEATASNPDDLNMIRSLIEDKGGMDMMNVFIKNNMCKALTEVPGSFHSRIKHILSQLQVRKHRTPGTDTMTPSVTGTPSILTPGDLGVTPYTPASGLTPYTPASTSTPEPERVRFLHKGSFDVMVPEEISDAPIFEVPELPDSPERSSRTLDPTVSWVGEPQEEPPADDTRNTIESAPLLASQQSPDATESASAGAPEPTLVGSQTDCVIDIKGKFAL